LNNNSYYKTHLLQYAIMKLASRNALQLSFQRPPKTVWRPCQLLKVQRRSQRHKQSSIPPRPLQDLAADSLAAQPKDFSLYQASVQRRITLVSQASHINR